MSESVAISDARGARGVVPSRPGHGEDGSSLKPNSPEKARSPVFIHLVFCTNTRGDLKISQDHLLEGRPLAVQAPPKRQIFREPTCIRGPAGAAVRGNVWLW